MISIAIPFHGNRIEWSIRTIDNMHNYGFVSEIVLTLEPGFEQRIISATRNYKKVRLIKNEQKLGSFRNKIKVVSECKDEWVALFDSDNVFGAAYIGAWYNEKKNKEVIYSPSMGLPVLNYEKFIGMDIDFKKAVSMMADNQFNMLMNTMNYIFYREKYLDSMRDAIASSYDPVAADGIWANFNCWKNGMIMRVLKGMVYNHSVHPGSTYLMNAGVSEIEQNKIKDMMRTYFGAPEIADVKAVAPADWSSVPKKPEQEYVKKSELLSD